MKFSLYKIFVYFIIVIAYGVIAFKLATYDDYPSLFKQFTSNFSTNWLFLLACLVLMRCVSYREYFPQKSYYINPPRTGRWHCHSKQTRRHTHPRFIATRRQQSIRNHYGFHRLLDSLFRNHNYWSYHIIPLFCNIFCRFFLLRRLFHTIK